MTILVEKGTFLLSKRTTDPFIVQRRKIEWQLTELRKYATFIEFFQEQFEMAGNNFENKRPLFQHLASFLTTRNANQCRMFHAQRLMENDGNLDKVVESFRETIHKHQQWFTFYSHALKNLPKITQKPIFSLVTKSSEINGRQKDNLYQQLSCQSKIKEDQLPTDADYCFGLPSVPSKERLQFTFEEKQEYSLEKINKPETKVPNNQIYSEVKHSQQGKRQSKSSLEMMKKNQRWIDCHNSFLLWIQKVNQLMMKDNCI